MAADFDQVAAEIIRFAGEEAYSPPTVIHWGMLLEASLKPLYERGVRVLSGGFGFHQGAPHVHYCLDERRCEYLTRNGLLKDFASGIVFSRYALVCNSTPVEQVAPILEPLAQNPWRAEIMDLFTHEQYFWPFYRAYLPDHAERLDVTIRWVTEHGYEPVFFHEGFLGITK